MKLDPESTPMKKAHSPSLCSLTAIAIAVVSCHRPASSGATGPQPPPGEVWLTPSQVKDANIEVQVVEPRDLDDTIFTSGRIALEDVRAGHVLSPVTGRVVSIKAALGERVKKGDPLAVIESPDIGNVVSDEHKAQADLIAADHDRKRKKGLFEQRAGSLADVEASEDNYRKARAELERARKKQYLLRVGNVDTVTQQYTLPSPIDGEILARNINPGVEVTGQYSGGTTQELFTIGEIARVWMMGDLYEMDSSRVHVGTTATVTVVAYPNTEFKGRVDWVSGMFDPTTRTAKVRCTFDNPEKKLRPEMYATVEISVDKKTALAVPRNSVLRLGDAKVVFVQVGEAGGGQGTVRFKRVPVQVDEGESSPWLEVKHGLVQGQKVVINGAILLSQKL